MESSKWSHDFIERRLAEHRRWQHDLEAQWSHEIIDEVQCLPKRQVRSGDLFSIAPDVVQRDLVVRQ